jgi:hypothetical protein
MKYYNEYILEKYINNDNAELILEKGIFSVYRDIQHKVLKEYSSQLYFVATFNSAIVSLYPVVKQMLYNSNFDINLNKYQIVLLTIFAIAEIIHVNNDAIKDIRKKLAKDHLMVHLEVVKRSLFSIQKIVKVVAKTVGKTISLFIDMLAYVTLLVPINDALIEILQEDGINVDTIWKKVLGLGIGLGILTFKNIVVRILDKLGLHTSTKIEDKVENVIKDEQKKKENIYHKMRTKERIK